MKCFLIISCLFLSLASYSQSKGYEISANVFMAYDISKVEPDIGSWNGFIEIKGGDIGLLVPIKNRIFLETGYRYKEHWATWSGQFFGSSHLIERTHSIPIRPALQIRLFDDIFTVRLGSGVLLNFSGSNNTYVRSDDLALLMFPGSAPIGNYTFYDEATVHATKFAVSWDSRIHIGIPVSNKIGFNFGYGFNRGFKSYVEGQYLEVLGTGFNRGTISYQGTYSYFFGGLQYSF